MPRIVNKRYLGKRTVYNMTVDKVHNYITAKGTVLHNCDMVRYYCVSRKLQAEAELSEAEQREQREMLEAEEGYESYMCGGEPSMAYMGVSA